jgi:hypothetical protein
MQDVAHPDVPSYVVPVVLHASAAARAAAFVCVPSVLQSKKVWPRPFECWVWQAVLLLQQAVPAQQLAPHVWAGSGQAQLPAAHPWPVGQAVSQVPQFLGSVFTSTHALPQSVRPCGHVHWPNWQISGAGHT